MKLQDYGFKADVTWITANYKGKGCNGRSWNTSTINNAYFNKSIDLIKWIEAVNWGTTIKYKVVIYKNNFYKIYHGNNEYYSGISEDEYRPLYTIDYKSIRPDIKLRLRAMISLFDKQQKQWRNAVRYFSEHSGRYQLPDQQYNYAHAPKLGLKVKYLKTPEQYLELKYKYIKG